MKSLEQGQDRDQEDATQVIPLPCTAPSGYYCYGRTAAERPGTPLRAPQLQPQPTQELEPRFAHSSVKVAAAVDSAIAASGLDPWLILAMIHVESSGRVGARSEYGARGLMQLVPTTAAEQARIAGIDYYDGAEYDPGINVTLGCAYLARLLALYDGDIETALAAYNTGPATVAIEGINSAGRRYVKKILSSKEKLKGGKL